jgi:hypothetical protein
MAMCRPPRTNGCSVTSKQKSLIASEMDQAFHQKGVVPAARLELARLAAADFESDSVLSTGAGWGLISFRIDSEKPLNFYL